MEEIAIGTNKLEDLFYSKMTISSENSENSENHIEDKRKLAEKEIIVNKDDKSFRLYTTLGKRIISKYEIKLNVNRQEKFQKIKNDIQLLDTNIKNNKSLSTQNLYKRNKNISLLDQIRNIFNSQNQVVPNKESNKIKNINNKFQIIKSIKVNRENLLNKNKMSINIKSNENENFKIFFKTEVDSQKKIKLPQINSFKNKKNEKKEFCQYENYPFTPYNKTENSNFLIQKSFDSSIIPMKENIYSKFQLKEFLLLSKINNKPFK